CRSFPSALSPALYSYPLSLHDALPIMAKSPSTAGRRPASKQEDRFVLRLPREYHEQLAVISRRNRRSMNAEITLLLEQFVAEKALSAPDRIGLDPEACSGALDESAMKVIEKFKRCSLEKQKALLDLLE